MKSKEYWASRAIALEYHIQTSTKKAIEEIARLYGVAASAIEKEVVKVRRELMRLNEITEEDVHKLLSSAASDESYSELLHLLKLTDDPKEISKIKNKINEQAYGTRITRLNSLYNKIFSEIVKAAIAEREICDILFDQVFQESYLTTIFDLAKGFDCGIDFDVIPQKAIEAVLSESWQSGNYSKRIWAHGEAFEKQLKETITSGLLSGKSTSKMASELAGFSEQGRYTAERLVRTESAHFMAEGQKRAYEEVGIKQYRFIASLSERTCEVCGNLDNKVFSVEEALSGVNFNPMHPNCRCTTIAADTKLSSRLAEDSATGKKYKVDGNMSFNEWKESLSNEQKQAFNLHVRQFKNEASDKKQYEKYIKRLGTENMPKTFDKFQELKYSKVDKWEDLKYYYDNIAGRPIEYVKIDRELLRLGITNKGKACPIDKTVRAYILPEAGSKDAYHIMKRMRERNITDDEIRTFKDEALVSFEQWRGSRCMYFNENGMCVISKKDDEWIYKTAWKKEDFDEETLKLLKVVKKYVK